MTVGQLYGTTFMERRLPYGAGIVGDQVGLGKVNDIAPRSENHSDV
jgi:hypothetical protein